MAIDKTADPLDTGLGCAGLLIGEPVSIIVNGLVLRTLWAWFAVPTFHAPHLTLPVAIGVDLIVSQVVCPHLPPKKDDESVAGFMWSRVWAYGIFRPLLFLGLGYIIHLFH